MISSYSVGIYQRKLEQLVDENNCRVGVSELAVRLPLSTYGLVFLFFVGQCASKHSVSAELMQELLWTLACFALEQLFGIGFFRLRDNHPLLRCLFVEENHTRSNPNE